MDYIQKLYIKTWTTYKNFIQKHGLHTKTLYRNMDYIQKLYIETWTTYKNFI